MLTISDSVAQVLATCGHLERARYRGDTKAGDQYLHIKHMVMYTYIYIYYIRYLHKMNHKISNDTSMIQCFTIVY